jgi:hypothetical protein
MRRQAKEKAMERITKMTKRTKTKKMLVVSKQDPGTAGAGDTATEYGRRASGRMGGG